MTKRTEVLSMSLLMLMVVAILVIFVQVSLLRDKVRWLDERVAMQSSPLVTTSSLPMATSAISAHSSAIPALEIKNNALVNDKGQVLISDVEAAGLKTVECQTDETGLYLLRQDGALFLEGCGEVGGTMWLYSSSTNTFTKRNVRFAFGSGFASPDSRYEVVLGEEDPDGEVRRLTVKDFMEDRESVEGLLPKVFSYTQTISDFDGSPIGIIPWSKNMPLPIADVYSAVTPLTFGETRLPVMQKVITINRTF